MLPIRPILITLPFLAAILFVLSCSTQPDDHAELPGSVLKFTDPPPPQEKEQWEPVVVPETPTIIAVDENGQPVEGAKVHVVCLHTSSSEFFQQDAVTGKDGRTQLDLSELKDKEIVTFTLIVDSQQHAVRRVVFSTFQDDANRIPFTEEYTVTLQDGERLSGIVTDTEGNPIANVRVGVRTLFEIPEAPLPEMTTDENGRWETRIVEKNSRMTLLSLEHPDFAAVELDARFAGHEKVKMKPGRSIRGTVRDASGNPIAGAVVSWRIFREPRQILTDENGQFAITGLQPGRQRFVVSAENCVSKEEEADLRRTNATVDVTLEPAAPLKLRIVDEDGQPVHGVQVFAKNKTDDSRYDLNGVGDQIHVGENGSWVWERAPTDPAVYTFYRYHYYESSETGDALRKQREYPEYWGTHYQSEQESYSLVPREEEYVIVMQRFRRLPEQPTKLVVPKTMNLRVLDSNGKPLAGAEIQAEISFNLVTDFGPYFQPFKRKALTDSNGRCLIDFDQVNRSCVYCFRLKIDAGDALVPVTAVWSDPGYGFKARYPNGDPRLPAEWEVRLPRRETRSGKVVDTEGRPLEGATVFLPTLESLSFDSGHKKLLPGGVRTTTDVKGEWTQERFYPDPKRMAKDAPKAAVSLQGYEEQQLPLSSVVNQTVKLRKLKPEEERAAPPEMVIPLPGFNKWPTSELPLKIRAIDQNGDPVPGVKIESIVDEAGLRDYVYVDLDGYGELEWNNAPAGEMEYEFACWTSGYRFKDYDRTFRMEPREEEYVITLEYRDPAAEIAKMEAEWKNYVKRTVIYRVTDAETGKPVDAFRYQFGEFQEQGDKRVFGRGWGQVRYSREGLLERQSLSPENQTHDQPCVFEADGYAPFQGIIEWPAEYHEPITVDVKLNKRETDELRDTKENWEEKEFVVVTPSP